MCVRKIMLRTIWGSTEWEGWDAEGGGDELEISSYGQKILKKKDLMVLPKNSSGFELKTGKQKMIL